MFSCALFGALVFLCRACDRRHRFCSTECAAAKYRRNRNATASWRSKTDKGRSQNAERQRRWRERQREGRESLPAAPQPVTYHQASAAPSTAKHSQHVEVAEAPTRPSGDRTIRAPQSPRRPLPVQFLWRIPVLPSVSPRGLARPQSVAPLTAGIKRILTVAYNIAQLQKIVKQLLATRGVGHRIPEGQGLLFPDLLIARRNRSAQRGVWRRRWRR